MSTDRQKSFIGTLSCEGDPVSIDNFYGSNRKSLLVAKRGRTPTKFYFRVERGSYVMYVRDEKHQGKLVNINSHGELAVSSAHEAGEIQFDLDSMSLDSMKTDRIQLNLYAHHRRLLTISGTTSNPLDHNRHAIPESKYFSVDRPQLFANFTLNILERNVPYLDHPDEV
ncbi:hypothetical protein [Pseudomonas purpurea]|uniref:hypothetical protein n=1 Tax=Pseudomonas purpurea TaxID=3136737 RepID=UPI003264DA93